MKKGYWISLYTKVDNQENLKKYAETVTPIIKKKIFTLLFCSHMVFVEKH